MKPEKFPRIGLGTWRNTFPGRCERSIATAIDMGYRHLDTARAYSNEEFVGQGVRLSSVEREEIIVATKVHPDDLSYEGVSESVDKSLDALGFDYIDLLYVHWPARAYDPPATWAAFNELWKDGKVKNIGVSNFTIDLLKEAKEYSVAPIVANQIEFHPFLRQHDMVEYAQEDGHILVAYSPIGRGRVFEIPEIQEIASKHDASEAQVSLAWLMEMKNVVPIPMADIEIHQRENYRAKQLTLDQDDIEKIESISYQQRLVDPEYAPWNS